MALILLTARQYKQDMKWSLLPDNKVDTIQLQPISNELSEEDKNLHTEPFLEAVPFYQENTLSLPLADTYEATHWRHMYNEHYVSFATREFAKARVECVMAAGSRIVTLDKAISGTPAVQLQLSGKTYEVARGGSTYESYPGRSDFQNKNYNLVQWIKAHATNAHDYLTWNYEGNSFSMNPFVRHWGVDTLPLVGYAATTENDILTTWWAVKSVGTMAFKSYWYEWTSFGTTDRKRIMYPVGASASRDGIAAYETAINIYDQRIQMPVVIQKLDDYNYKVSWAAPVRMAYAAATRSFVVAAYAELDNWAFVDEVSSVSVIFNGKAYNTDPVDLSYSLDASGELSETPSNQHPLRLNKSEGFTLGTECGGELWHEKLSKDLLTKYQKGKYIVECSVPCSWAMQNQVHVGTEMQVALQDGTRVQRDGVVCLFEVKNIEKVFRNSEFTYRLKLMEV